jgi:hypothetical protein
MLDQACESSYRRAREAAGSAAQAPMSKHTILFLAANPRGTERRALDREARSIAEELQRSEGRNCFELETRYGAEPARASSSSCGSRCSARSGWRYAGASRTLAI